MHRAQPGNTGSELILAHGWIHGVRVDPNTAVLDLERRLRCRVCNGNVTISIA